MAEFNIVGPNFNSTTDTKLFTSVQEDEEGIQPELTPLVESDVSMAHLLARLGKFQSISEAKKNGWAKPIPSGWSEFTIGKAAKRWDIWIWNPTDRVFSDD